MSRGGAAGSGGGCGEAFAVDPAAEEKEGTPKVYFDLDAKSFQLDAHWPLGYARN